MLHLVLQLQVHLLFTLSKFIVKSYFVWDISFIFVYQ